jgi:DNA polymerase/3'-5' exonuclease PolX
MHIKGIGPRIMGKIMELIETGKMHKLEGYRKD